MLKFRISICWDYLIVLFIDIHLESVMLCLQKLFFISSKVHRERSGLLTTLFDEFRVLWG